MKTLIRNLLMLAAVLSASANALAYDFIVDGIYYNILSEDDKTVEVTYKEYYNQSDYTGDVVIPNQVSYNNDTYSVTTIGGSAFSGCSSLTSVTIPNSVTTIGGSAFSGCSSLTSVTIPNSVTSIGNYSFDDCRSLKYLTIEGGGEILSLGYNYDSRSYSKDGEGLFHDCPLETVYLGRNLSYSSDRRYGYSPFYNTPIKELIIENSVTSIGSSAFENCSSLTSVIIPNSVTTIGGSAFSGCSSLTSVTIPNSVTSIGNSAFCGCSSLTSVIIPNSVTTIGGSAFSGCSSLTSVTIPNSVTSIGNSAFSGCSSIKNLIIEDGGETLRLGYNYYFYYDYSGHGEGLFYDCPLETVYLGRNLSYEATYREGYSPFYNTPIKELIIENSVTSIGSSAFENCSSLTSVIIPNSVTTIDDSAFCRCSSLTSIIIPNSVTTIGGSAFYGCSSLISVKIGSGVLFIGTNAFYSTNLKKVVWLPNTPPAGYNNVSSARNYVANDSYSKLDNVTVYPYLSSMFEVGGLKYVPVSPSERTCEAIDCSYDDTAANIVIDKTVNYQGIEMTLLDVNDYACYGNDSIKTLQIKEYAGNIGIKSFYDCDNLGAVDIQTMAGNIGENSFYDCGNLKTVDIQNLEGNIGKSSFNGCSNLETVNINDMIGSIGDKAFYDCENLKGIEIPNTVAGIGESCFYGCSSLEYAKIGSGISSLPESCFRGCYSLPEIVIPSTVGRIGNNAFYGCSALARVDIANRQTELVLGYNSEYSNSDQKPLFSDCPLDSVYIGGNISYGTGSGSGYSPFYRNTSLRAVKITDQETEISENEFYGCTGLKRVELGDGIESIGNYAFSGCSALKSFTFGNSLATIGNEAFSDCTAMTRLVSKTEVPPVCGSQALDDINKWTCELFVPQKSLEAYKAAEQWKEFFFIKGDDSGESSGIGNVASKEEISVISRNGYIEITGVENQEVEVYNLSGQLVYSGTETVIDVPAKGIYIVHVSGQTFKIIL